jgi:hypothetical protein
MRELLVDRDDEKRVERGAFCRVRDCKAETIRIDRTLGRRSAVKFLVSLGLNSRARTARANELATGHSGSDYPMDQIDV